MSVLLESNVSFYCCVAIAECFETNNSISSLSILLVFLSVKYASDLVSYVEFNRVIISSSCSLATPTLLHPPASPQPHHGGEKLIRSWSDRVPEFGKYMLHELNFTLS